MYTVNGNFSSATIRKTKNHLTCSKRVADTSMPHLSSLLIKSTVNILASNSTCSQTIERGILKSAHCVDYNEITPIKGLTSKRISARQTSSLTYRSVSRTMSVQMSSTSLKPSSLMYARSPPIMDSTVKSTLIQGIHKLCVHTRGSRVEKSLGRT